MDYAKRIKDLRKKSRLTQEKLAQTMGLETPNFISQIETGKKRVGLSVITKFCNAMGIELADFFRETPEQIDIANSIPIIDLSSASVDNSYDADYHISTPSRKYKSNDMAIVGLANKNVLIRKVRSSDDLLILECSNPSAEAKIVKLSDVKFVHPVLWVRYQMPLSLLPRC
jgi:transcriptional regulator with XRE-family HTH domain